jgi:hypothetical protein
MYEVSLQRRLVVLVLAALLSLSVAIAAAGVLAADVRAVEVGCVHAEEETGECLPGGSNQREGLQRAADKRSDELGSSSFGQANQLFT